MGAGQLSVLMGFDIRYLVVHPIPLFEPSTYGLCIITIYNDCIKMKPLEYIH